MRKVQSIADKAVLDGQTIPEFRGRKERVAYFAPQLRLELPYSVLNTALVVSISGKDEVGRTAWIAHKAAREDYGCHATGALQCADNGFVVHGRYLMNELRYGGSVFEFRIKLPGRFLLFRRHYFAAAFECDGKSPLCENP